MTSREQELRRKLHCYELNTYPKKCVAAGFVWKRTGAPGVQCSGFERCLAQAKSTPRAPDPDINRMVFHAKGHPPKSIWQL